MFMSLSPKQKIGPLISHTKHKDIKDPCPVFDGSVWHLYGSGGDVRSENWRILHATAQSPTGPWSEQDDAELAGVSGKHVAAPGVVYDGGIFHMFVQTEFMGPGGSVEYLVSYDGHAFFRTGTALRSFRGTEEAGVYDPHPAVVKGKKYIAYASMPEKCVDGRMICEPDIYLAKSESDSWEGPWVRSGKILSHADIAHHHNRPGQASYEWGIEGPQLLELPSGKILLNGTCFLPTGEFGTRQRVFFALAEKPEGPYRSIGPVVDPGDDRWGSGENGHATALLQGGELLLYYQARNLKAGDGCWRYGLTRFDARDLDAVMAAV